MRWVVHATLWPLYPQERPGTHRIGGWVGPRDGLDRCGKSPPPHTPGFDPRTVQPVQVATPTAAIRRQLQCFQLRAL